jgi:hypothetical protein
VQAVVFKTGHLSSTILVALILFAGLMLGGVGGYFINDLSRSAPGAPSASSSQTSPWGSDFARSVARHAATERTETDSTTGYNFALSIGRHAASERAEATSSVSSTQ